MDGGGLPIIALTASVLEEDKKKWVWLFYDAPH
jgi:hypothetical protein